MPPTDHASEPGPRRDRFVFSETERSRTRHTSSKYDWTLVACLDNMVVGQMELMTDEADEHPEVSVRMVRSARAGTGSALIDELVRRYPDHFIRGGPISDHEPGGRQFLRHRLGGGLPTIHGPECSEDRCVCATELREFEEADSGVARRFHEFTDGVSRRLCPDGRVK